MSDLDEQIRADLHTIVAQAPAPVPVEAIRRRAALSTRPRLRSARPVRHRARFVFVGVLVVGVVVAVAAFQGRGPGWGTAAMSPDEIAAATSRPADEPPFEEDVDWPHHLVALDNDWELLLTEELRPGFGELETTQTFASDNDVRPVTTQTFATDDGGLLHLEIIEASGITQDENMDSVAGHPYTTGHIPPETPGVSATWQWDTANVYIRASGITEPDGRELVASLQPRDGDPIRGFEPRQTDLELISERVHGSDSDSTNPAVVRAWYGQEIETDDGIRTETKLKLVAMAPDGQPPDLRSVTPVSGGGSIKEIAGREVLLDIGEVLTGWTTAAWYRDTGELLTLSVKDLPDDDDLSELAAIIEAVEPVDQETWDAAVADLSDRIADNPIVQEATIGDVTVVAREGSIDLNGDPLSHLCIIPADQPETCRANLSLRDGGVVTTPVGTLYSTILSVGSVEISAVIDGVWWVATFDEASSLGIGGFDDVTVTTDVGDVRMASSEDHRLFVAALPSSATRAELADIGQDYAFAERWRPSSAP